MKKIWTLVLVLVLAVSAMFVFTACDKEPEEPTVVETFYKVTYVYKSGDKTTELSTQQVSDIAGFTAEQIAALDSVKNNGYGFSGWFADADCTVPFDFTQKPTADVTVYASRGNLAGENVEWFPLYAGEGFILMFNGTGAMYDYDNKSDTPWADIAPLVTGVSFGEGITRIGNYTCTDMAALDFVYVPKSVKTIGDYAFAGSSVMSVAMRNGVKTIGTAAFSGCKNLVSVVLPADLETLGEDAFYDVPKLANVGFFGDGDIMEDPATEGKNFKFVENCLIDVVNKTLVVANNAATITVDPSVKVIADGAFINKATLTTVYLPENLTKIGDNAFSTCAKLAKVLVAEKDAYLVNTKAVVIELPDTVEYLGKSAFNKCTAINGAIYLGNKITEIADATFFGCTKITNVVVPATVTNIGATAFKDCNGLLNVYFKGNETQFNAITCGVDNYKFVDMAVHFFYSQEEPAAAGPFWFNAADEDGKDLGLRQWYFSIHYKTHAQNNSQLKYIFTDYVEVDQETYKATCGEANVTFRENMKVDGYTYLGFKEALFTGTGADKKWTVLSGNVDHTAYRTQGISDGGGIQLTYSGTTANIKLNAKFDEETMSNKTWDFAKLDATLFAWKTNANGVRRDTLTTVNLGTGIVYYGAYSLANFAMKELSIPADVEKVHYTFVDNTTQLKNIYYQGTTPLKVVNSNGEEVALNQPGVTIYTKYVAGETDTTKNGAYWTEIEGKKLVWSLKDGALTIGGAAEMVNFAAAADAPWYAADIKSVAIDAGITKIGENILNGDESVATIKIPASVKVIPANAFAGTAAIKNLAAAADGCGYIDGHLIKVVDATKIGERFNVPRNTYSISEEAFKDITALKKVYVTRTVTYIAPTAFEGTGLETVYYDGLPKAWADIAEGVEVDNVLYATIKTPTIADFMDYKWFKIDTETLAITELDLKEEDNVTITLKVVEAKSTNKNKQFLWIMNGNTRVDLNGGGEFTMVVNKTLGGILPDAYVAFDAVNTSNCWTKDGNGQYTVPKAGHGNVFCSHDATFAYIGWADENGKVYATTITEALVANGDIELTVVWPSNAK